MGADSWETSDGRLDKSKNDSLTATLSSTGLGEEHRSEGGLVSDEEALDATSCESSLAWKKVRHVADTLQMSCGLVAKILADEIEQRLQDDGVTVHLLTCLKSFVGRVLENLAEMKSMLVDAQRRGEN